MAMEKESEFDTLARLIKEEGDAIRAEMVTKEDARQFATKDDIRTMATKEDVRIIVTDAVDNAKKELLDEIRPLARAVDKDAVTIVDHGRRIRRIEKHLDLES